MRARHRVVGAHGPKRGSRRAASITPFFSLSTGRGAENFTTMSHTRPHSKEAAFRNAKIFIVDFSSGLKANIIWSVTFCWTGLERLTGTRTHGRGVECGGLPGVGQGWKRMQRVGSVGITHIWRTMQGFVEDQEVSESAEGVAMKCRGHDCYCTIYGTTAYCGRQACTTCPQKQALEPC